MEVSITKAENLKPKPDETQLGFGQIYTDHMFNMDYHPDKGWHDARIEPYGPLVLDPATMFLHYAQGVFEGLKAFRTESGGIQLFRPKDNIRRMNRSSKRLCIPEIDEAFFLDALKQLVDLEKDWVPSEPGTSLYIRPDGHRHGSLPGGARIPHLSLFHHPVPGGGLLCRRLQPG